MPPSLAVGLGQLWQQGGQILLDGYVQDVSSRVLKFPYDIILDVAV